MKFKDLKESFKTLHEEDLGIEKLYNSLNIPAWWDYDYGDNTMHLSLTQGGIPAMATIELLGDTFKVIYHEGIFTHKPNYPFEELSNALYFEESLELSFDDAVKYLNKVMETVDGFNFKTISVQNIKQLVVDCLQNMTIDIDTAIDDINRNAKDINDIMEYFYIGTNDVRTILNSKFLEEIAVSIR